MEYLEINGVKYKVLTVANGIPILKCTSKEFKHPDGRIDVTIYPEPLSLIGEVQDPA